MRNFIVTTPSIKILHRVAVLQVYQIAAFCFRRNFDILQRVCWSTRETPLPEYVYPTSFNILRKKMFAFMFEDSVCGPWEGDKSCKAEFRKKFQYHIGYDAHCELLFRSLKKTVTVSQPCGQLKETDGGVKDGLVDTDSDVEELKNKRHVRRYGQASETSPAESTSNVLLLQILSKLEATVSTFQGNVSTLQDSVTTLQGTVSTLEGIMVSFHSVRKNFHTMGNLPLAVFFVFLPAVFALSGRNPVFR